MRLRVTQSVITCGRSIDKGVGNFDKVFGQHLIDVGVAVDLSKQDAGSREAPYQTKIDPPSDIVKPAPAKKKPAKVSRVKKILSSASLPGQVSRKKTATQSKEKGE